MNHEDFEGTEQSQVFPYHRQIAENFIMVWCVQCWIKITKTQ